MLVWVLAAMSEGRSRLNSKLITLAISIVYHNLTDVWNQATAGMLDKTHAQIVSEAYDRWRMASNVSRILYD